MFHTNNTGLNTNNYNAAVFAAITGSMVTTESSELNKICDEASALALVALNNKSQEKDTAILVPEHNVNSAILIEQHSTVHLSGLLDKISGLEKAFGKKNKKTKKAKKEVEKDDKPSASPVEVVSIEVPLAYQAIGEDGTLGEVMLSMPNGEVIEVAKDTDGCQNVIDVVASEKVLEVEAAIQTSETPEVVKAVEAAIEKVPAEEQKTNPMIAAMARANERRATQPQHAHAGKTDVRRRKVAEPK